MKKIISFCLAAVILSLSLLSLTSCGQDACVYYTERNTVGRDIRYAKIEFKDYGTVYLLLDATTAPISVNNFLDLANSKFYDGLTMHRIISDFMIQGGDPNANGSGGSENEIYGEFYANGYLHNDIKHLYGVISMARGDDPNSASSQFFICNADSSHLDGNYAAFGYVIAGLGIVDKITSETVKYADASSGTIKDKSKQAVILSIREITKEEALEATNG